MAQSVTLENVINKLQIQDANAQTTMDTAAIRPEQIANHTIAKSEIILGITPEDFVVEHGASAFDIQKLREKFAKICRDFNLPLEWNTSSQALGFCSKVLFEVGPASRQVKKKSQGDKVWGFRFPYSSLDRKLVVHTAFICTYKTEGATHADVDSQTKIILTVKQVGLLAIHTFNRLTDLAYGRPDQTVLMTPLAGAIFSKDSLEAIHKELSELAIRKGVQPAENIQTIIKQVNSSCQSGGQYLNESEMYIAAVAVITATRNVKNENVKYSIIAKTLKQYQTAGKAWDQEKFLIFSGHATGGLPSELMPQTLIEAYSKEQTTRMQFRLAARQTEMTVKIADIRNILQQSAPLSSPTSVQQVSETDEVITSGVSQQHPLQTITKLSPSYDILLWDELKKAKFSINDRDGKPIDLLSWPKEERCT